MQISPTSSFPLHFSDPTNSSKATSSSPLLDNNISFSGQNIAISYQNFCNIYRIHSDNSITTDIVFKTEAPISCTIFNHKIGLCLYCDSSNVLIFHKFLFSYDSETKQTVINVKTMKFPEIFVTPEKLLFISKEPKNLPLLLYPRFTNLFLIDFDNKTSKKIFHINLFSKQ